MVEILHLSPFNVFIRFINRSNLFTLYYLFVVKVRLKDSLVSSLQFCKAKDTELAWIDGVLDMRVVKVDTGVMLEEGTKEEVEDGELAMDVAPADLEMDHSATVAAAAQRAMKNLFGEDEKEVSEESDVIPTLEPLPTHEVRQHVLISHSPAEIGTDMINSQYEFGGRGRNVWKINLWSLNS